MRLLPLCLCAFVVQASLAREPIAFSIHDAGPQMVQSKPKPSFSIYRSEEATTNTAPGIVFSVHDAEPLDELADKPECAEVRSVNRVLVFYHEKPTTETTREYVCDGKFCGWQNRTWTRSPKDCESFLAKLKKLPDPWKVGDDDCVHFKPVKADDPSNAKLVKELKITFGDLPLLVKEAEPEKRKKAAGMDGADAAHVYLKWYVKPVPEGETAVVERCLPMSPLEGIQFASEQWTYPGNIRHHLTDPRFPHHLPKALVDSWSDAQCVGWHNWHHQVMSGQRSATSRQRKPTSVKQTAVRSPLEARIATVAQSLVRRPPVQMVAATNSRDSKSKKKRNERYGSGVAMNASVFARKSLAASSRSIKSRSSIRLLG